MSRANSLKKAVRQIIEHAERAVDEQNAQTEQQRSENAKALGGKRINRKVKRSALHSSMTAGSSRAQSSSGGFSCGSCSRATASTNGRHACPVRSHTISTSMASRTLVSTTSGTGSLEAQDRGESSTSPSPGVASAEAHFDLRDAACSSSGHPPPDQVVPEDPKTVTKAAFPFTSVTVQPPTPLTCVTPNAATAEQRQHPLSLAALQASMEAARRSGRLGFASIRGMSLDSAHVQAASDSEVPSASSSIKRTVDVKHSFSDNSLRGKHL